MQTQERTNSRHLTTSGDRASTVAARARSAATLLREAWASLPRPAHVAACVVVVAAVATALTSDVPTASALTVAAAVPAVVVDLHVRRLPDPLVALAAAIGLVTLVGAAVAGASSSVGGLVLGALAMGGPMLVLHLVSPRSLGFGDVKLGAVLGAALGAMHWQLALSALALAAGMSAVVALVGRRTTIAFGPGLLVGALLALAAHPLFMPPSAEWPTAAEASIGSPIATAHEEHR